MLTSYKLEPYLSSIYKKYEVHKVNPSVVELDQLKMMMFSDVDFLNYLDNKKSTLQIIFDGVIYKKNIK